MKLSIILPILSAGANKQKENKDGNKSAERFVASEVTNNCSVEVPSKGGTFFAIGNGGFMSTGGFIKLDNYPSVINCKHVVRANPFCAEIQIQYQSVATEPDCDYDFFRFEWGETITPARCGCFGNGCRSKFKDQENYFVDYMEGNEDYMDEMIGPNSLTVHSNTFTFYFKSDDYYSSGHVAFNWRCVRYGSRTTTTTTTTTTATTTTPM